VELLARPRLTDLPDNPVGKVTDLLRAIFPECTEVDLPEVVNLTDALATPAGDAIYVEAVELHRIDDDRILRYDLTLPLLMTLRTSATPSSVVQRKGIPIRASGCNAPRAFHQAEVFQLDNREALDPWTVTGRVLQSVDRILPGRSVRIVRPNTRCAGRRGNCLSRSTVTGTK